MSDSSAPVKGPLSGDESAPLGTCEKCGRKPAKMIYRGKAICRSCAE